MIREIKGNLLDFPDGINAIVHGANTLNIMGGGIAKQIATRYPEAKYADEAFYLMSKALSDNMLGYASIAEVEGKGRIYNLYQQSTVGVNGRHVNYEALYRGLEFVHKNIEGRGVLSSTVVGFPKFMSCGLAGGEWSIVRPMIDYIFDGSEVVIVEFDE